MTYVPPAYVYGLKSALGDTTRGATPVEQLATLDLVFPRQSLAWYDVLARLYDLCNKHAADFSHAGASLALITQEIVAPRRKPFYLASLGVSQLLNPPQQPGFPISIIIGRERKNCFVRLEPRCSEEHCIEKSLRRTLCETFPSLKSVTLQKWDYCWTSFYATAHSALLHFYDSSTKASWATTAPGPTKGHAFLKALEDGFVFALDERFKRPAVNRKDLTTNDPTP